MLKFIFLKFFKQTKEMDKSPDQTKILFNSQRLENITPGILVKSFWVSTVLAVILTLLALGVFIAVSQNSGNILIGSVIGFGLHFLLLSASGRISSALSSILDD
jgi:heme/copper-type cytochrome/quinol oxidase subunit 4